MRLVIIKLSPDVINGGIGSAVVGLFDRAGIKTMEFSIPGRMFAKDFEYKEGQELLLKPADQF